MQLSLNLSSKLLMLPRMIRKKTSLLRKSLKMLQSLITKIKRRKMNPRRRLKSLRRIKSLQKRSSPSKKNKNLKIPLKILRKSDK